PITGSARNSNTGSQGTLVGGVREFTMDAYYDPEAKKPYFTLGEMVVQKGDKVRVKVKNTFGKHDFTIDEYNVNTVTPQDEVTTIEFTADKAGDFVYYCSSTGHRASGQWGMLKVQE
ncbi:MAG: cupredoxin domain-containing protein, partial [Candidatus Veblenbacteria bacterium]|nr:cupredoxin domain-containing protein [Candidatus Veblenbacteria bacterium]